MSLVEEINAMAKKMKKEASEPKPQCAGQNLGLVYRERKRARNRHHTEVDLVPLSKFYSFDIFFSTLT